jgi:excisionase family DNA binding protein
MAYHTLRDLYARKLGIFSVYRAHSRPVYGASGGAMMDNEVGRSGLESLLTVSEVSSMLRVSKSKAYSLMKSGELPAVRIGRSVRVREQDVDQFVLDHRDTD